MNTAMLTLHGVKCYDLEQIYFFLLIYRFISMSNFSFCLKSTSRQCFFRPILNAVCFYMSPHGSFWRRFDRYLCPWKMRRKSVLISNIDLPDVFNTSRISAGQILRIADFFFGTIQIKESLTRDLLWTAAFKRTPRRHWD